MFATSSSAALPFRLLQMTRFKFLGAALLLLTLSACVPRYIPNTEIRNTKDNREILDVISKYKDAFEAQDAQAIAALASTRYLDPRDNISYDTLISDLERDFEEVKQVQLDIAVRRIEVKKEVATVDYFYSSNVLIKTEGEDRWRSQTDDKRMTLVHEDGAWKVLSGF